MTLSRGSLLIGALLYSLFGVALLLRPDLLLELFNETFHRGEGVADIRATYGGLEIGIAVFLLYCWNSKKHVKLGLLFMALTFWGFSGGRLLGIFMDHPTAAWVPLAFWAEFLGGSYFFWIYKKGK